MTRYMIYYEPDEVEADNLDDAKQKYYDKATGFIHDLPLLLKIVPAEFVFDVDQEKPIND